jgi:hypothetical protein
MSTRKSAKPQPPTTIPLEDFAGQCDEPNYPELAAAEARAPICGFPRDTLGVRARQAFPRSAALERAAEEKIAAAFARLR